MKKGLVLLVMFLFVALVQCSMESKQEDHANMARSAAETAQPEQKIYCNAAIDDDFEGDIVMVVLDKKTGGINKIHDEGFFGSFERKYIEDQTRITIKDGRYPQYLNEENFHQIFMIKLPNDSKENVLNVIGQLQRIEGILYAGPSYKWHPQTATPNDTNYNLQWGLHGQHGIRAPEAWEITTGSDNVLVGVIDSGINLHGDLVPNLIPGPKINANNDIDGHGTQIAGIIGAVGDNTWGVAGVNWKVSMVSLSGFDSFAAACTYAINNDIGILTYATLTNAYNPDTYYAIGNYRGLFVCAAGNDGIDLNDPNLVPPTGHPKYAIYPAYYDLPNMIKVGAIDSTGALSPFSEGRFSNYGKTKVDLFAPGSNIYTTFPHNVRCKSCVKDQTVYHYNGYHYASGTSYAAPFVAGVAALIKSLYKGMTAQEIKARILNNVDTVSDDPALAGLTGKCVSGGRLNAYKALTNNAVVIGSADFIFEGTNIYNAQGQAVGDVLVGKLYIFENGNLVIVERGILTTPLNFYSYQDPDLIRIDNFSPNILTYLANSGIGSFNHIHPYLQIPCANGMGTNLWRRPYCFNIDSSGAAIEYSGERHYPGEPLTDNDERWLKLF